VAPLLSQLDWPRRTERLSLRPPAPDDLEAAWAYRRLDAVTMWITSAHPTFEAFAERWQQPESLAKTLVVERDGVVIGDLMVAVEDAWAQAEVVAHAQDVQAELGWCFAPEHGGRGYASEAVTELLRLGFDDLGLRRVRAECFAANEASWRLMERVGMRRESHARRDSLHRSGEWMDGYTYALLAEEWRAASVQRRDANGL
jgi:RimJ/RimL family protein N-acetyltransferase